MKTQISIKEANNAEFYEIFIDGDVKSIHILSYYFRRDIDENDENELDRKGHPKIWARVDGTFIIVPLEEFVQRFAEQGREYLDNELWAETKQYQFDMSEDDAVQELQAGEYEILDYSRITANTPCGAYVSLFGD